MSYFINKNKKLSTFPRRAGKGIAIPFYLVYISRNQTNKQMLINTKGSVWRIWDLQVQTIIDDQYVELKSYYEEIKNSDPDNWDKFVTKLGGEENALLFDSKKYFYDISVDPEKRYLNYARVLFGYLEIFKPSLGLIAFTDHNYYNPLLLDILFQFSKDAFCKCLCGVEINVSGVHMLVYFENPPFKKSSFSEGIKTFLDYLGINTPKNDKGVLTVSKKSVTDAIKIINDADGIYVFPHCNSDNGLFQERQSADKTLLADLFNYQEVVLLQCRSKKVVNKTRSYIESRPQHFHSKYVFTTSQDSRSLKDIGEADEDGNYTWVKADCHFNGLKQVLIERDRVDICDEPSLLKRMKNNPTKFIRSLEIKKRPSVQIEDVWFDNFKVKLNTGLVAVIGNKGAGKSALTDIIGLCGNTHQEPSNFSFLTSKKFRKVKPENLSEKFEAEIIWLDGTPVKKGLNENPDKRLPERVRYIPQNFLEKLCTDVESEDFEAEIKQIIFVHTPPERRMNKSSLDELISFKSGLVIDELERIKQALSKTNLSIIELESKATDNYKLEIENAIKLKEGELTAHENNKPLAPLKTNEDTSNEIVNKINEVRFRIETFETEIEEINAKLGTTILNQEELSQALQFFSNLKDSLDKIPNTSTLKILHKNGIDIKSVFSFSVDTKTIQDVLTQLSAQVTAYQANLNPAIENSKAYNLQNLNIHLIALQEQLDKPAKEQQVYLNNVKAWESQKKQIEGNTNTEGSLLYLREHLRYLNEDLHNNLISLYGGRTELVYQVFEKKQELIAIRKELFKPVTDFIESFKELKERYDVKINVTLEFGSFLESFFVYINQGRIGSFSGKEEGYKKMADILEKAHFDNKEGFTNFTNELLQHLRFDKRAEEPQPVDITTELRKGIELYQLYDFIFHFDYLQPAYSLNLGPKSLLELSPGERGALLLIFYLILDKDDIPLLIDQPEENLDNESVYHILVHFIKKVKDQRQIIIVTHNPNLAVVCDAEQIIHMNIDKENKNRVSFHSGSIENSTINKSAVNILEGTLPAFNNRDSKYQRTHDSQRVSKQSVPELQN